MLEHLHAGCKVVGTGVIGRMLLGGLEPVVDRHAGFECVQPGDLQQFRSEVEARHAGAPGSHGLGQQATAAPDIDDPLPCQRANAFDVPEPDGIQVVQRAHLALGVPPAAGRGLESRDLSCVDVDGLIHRQRPPGLRRPF